MKRITASICATSFRSRLLAFYDHQHRPLPWRDTPDPYRILVSEIMLQQTRVETVIPYYHRWLQRFPDLRTLADAPPDDVLKQWEGLGYYSRARNLHRAAQMVREHFDDVIPGTYDALRALPGVGTYTAGAVASIAFGEAVPAVDGNVRRVIARVFDLSDPTTAQTQEKVEALLDHERSGDFNQALMELGATVCTPRTPRCPSCPVQPLCLAHQRGTVELRPARKNRRPLPQEVVHTLIAERRGLVLVVQRPARGLLGGLWEFPEIADPGDYHYLGSVNHTFTHKRIEYRAYHTTQTVTIAGRWHDIATLDQLAFSTAQRRIAKLRYTS